MLVRVWRGQAVGVAPTEGVKLRRQMATAAGENQSRYLFFHGGEVNDLEVEEELITMATLAWGKACVEKGEADGVEEADL